MSYIDGFMVPVPRKNKQTYREVAAKAATVFKEYGAMRMVECWGDDVPSGKVNDMKGAVQLHDDENVVFSWIVWPSKEVRDAANEKMKTDPRMQMKDMPFDGARMIYGGFEVLFDTMEPKKA